jgi:hypothetical protein
VTKNRIILAAVLAAVGLAAYHYRDQLQGLATPAPAATPWWAGLWEGSGVQLDVAPGRKGAAGQLLLDYDGKFRLSQPLLTGEAQEGALLFVVDPGPRPALGSHYLLVPRSDSDKQGADLYRIRAPATTPLCLPGQTAGGKPALHPSFDPDRHEHAATLTRTGRPGSLRYRRDPHQPPDGAGPPDGRERLPARRKEEKLT